ncbi:carboxynorspermidine decarboxylase [Desulfobacula phenolica]|uniref:Carboxynorspermidine/carboxyspermidine decarboxylase n=1 Tax=Desulfobacula phenolica TaxID=90732 RepID=A0A1H2JML8_9BACT|nr:carboxynorspermidine decarboxylase [Desulfobacula phenolica]SDU57368.1 carboxynorspermidine decarboxylase [Desulfobacula phenolica]
MNGYTHYRFDPDTVPSPCFVVDEELLKHNLAILSDLKQQTGCKILLALKCFAMPRVFALLRTVLDGVCASSPHEARLGQEEFGREVHTFAAGYSRDDIIELCHTTDHLVFNSFSQLERFRELVKKTTASLGRTVTLGIRINPEHSEGATPMYDPCAKGSRLGVKKPQFCEDLLPHIKGLHWHNLCEQDADCLERTVKAVETSFGRYFSDMDYINFGGGHHITKPGYNLRLLEDIILSVKNRWNVEVYLEPGEAVALNTGYLVATVLDIVESDMNIAIMDASVPAHMPDVLEMPYRPHIIGSANPGQKKHTCRIAGASCLAGDVAGEYSFDTPLQVGSKLVFSDMAIYTMVKTNTFNGIRLPAIALFRSQDRQMEIVKTFGYSNFKNRL